LRNLPRLVKAFVSNAWSCAILAFVIKGVPSFGSYSKENEEDQAQTGDEDRRCGQIQGIRQKQSQGSDSKTYSPSHKQNLLEDLGMKLTNLGKMRASRRLRCMSAGPDGKIYIMAGERSSSRPCQFYSYNPSSGGYEDLGLMIVDRSPYYYWRGQQFDAMTTGKDGTVFIGESERRSHLFLFIP